jgi:cobalt/nickel transport system ATP-binding protein
MNEMVSEMEKIVEIDCITHIYPDLTKVQICGLEFVVHRGERVCILGANGCGKTTLLKHLVGLLMPKDGSVRVFGMDPWKYYSRSGRIGVVNRMWMNNQGRSTMIFSLLLELRSR